MPDKDWDKQRELARRALRGETVNTDELSDTTQITTSDNQNAEIEEKPEETRAASYNPVFDPKKVAEIEELLRKGGTNLQSVTEDISGPEPWQLNQTSALLQSTDAKQVVPDDTAPTPAEFYKPSLETPSPEIDKYREPIEHTSNLVEDTELQITAPPVSQETVVRLQELKKARPATTSQPKKRSGLKIAILIFLILVTLSLIMVVMSSDSSISRTPFPDPTSNQQPILVETLPQALTDLLPEYSGYIVFTEQIHEEEQVKEAPASVSSVIQALHWTLNTASQRGLLGSPRLLVMNEGNEQSFALIATIDNYSQVYAGMIAWEKQMYFDFVNTQLITPSQPSAFTDETIQNYDFRVLRSPEGHDIIAYTLGTGQYLVIGSSPEFILSHETELKRQLANQPLAT